MAKSSWLKLDGQALTAAAIAGATLALSSVMITSRQGLLAWASEAFAGTPPGSIVGEAMDLEAPIRAVLRSGARFIVRLDTCPFDDSAWEGDADPLGTIACGEDYQVTFDQGAREWVAVGPNEQALLAGSADPMVTSRFPADTTDNSFFIWGAKFTFDSEGRVLAENGVDVVGRLITADRGANP